MTLGASHLHRCNECGRRRVLLAALGAFWLVDAALQCQPPMFGRTFVTGILDPAARQLPRILELPGRWAIWLVAGDVGVWNALFASVQFLIAVAILSSLLPPPVDAEEASSGRRDRRHRGRRRRLSTLVDSTLGGSPRCRLLKAGLLISVVWSVGIWWVGEGVGGITAGTTAVGGAPGPAILYACLALLLWPRDGRDGHDGNRWWSARSATVVSLIPKVAWAAMWLGFAFLGLEPDNRSPGALYQAVIGMQTSEPGWIGALDRLLAWPLAHHGAEWSVLLAFLEAVVAISVFFPRVRRAGIALAIILAAVIWLAEDFGGVFTGTATDVGSGPLLALFAAAMWPVPRPRSSDAASSRPRAGAGSTASVLSLGRSDGGAG